MVQQAFRVDKVSTSNIEFKSNSFISSIASDASLASNVHLVLPTSVGSSGQVLATDGSGNLSFVSQGVGGPADLVQDNVNSLTSTVDSFGVYANNTFGAGGSNVSVANVTSQEFSIDGSTNTFTLVNTTDNVNKLLVSYGGIAQKPSEYTVSNTSLTLSNNRPLVSGTTVEVRYLDFEFSGSVGSGGGGGVISGTSYSSTLYNNTAAGITTFNDVSTPALPSYTIGKIGVYVNGVKLSNNAFSASTGDSVVLDNATLLGDDVEIVNFGMSSASLNDLTDVDITTNAPSNGQALVYVNANSKWEPGTVASSYGNSDVDLHLNRSTASTDQVLSWGGSDYVWVDQSGGGIAGTLGSLTKSFANNESSTITLSSNVSPVPNVSVFKEIAQAGFSSKGNWDVNANATNYDFYDEKPISYASSTLTPSATGDGTFTSSNPTVVGYQMSSTVNLNSTSPSITAQGSGGSWQVVEFDPTGNHVYMVSNTTQVGYAKTVYQYTMSTPHDLSTLNTTPANTLDMSSRVSGTIAHYCPLHITNSGYDLYFGDYQNNIIYQWKMSTAYDLSTASYHGASSAIFVNTMASLFIQPNGLTGYQVQDGITGSAVLREFTMSVAWDITTASLSGTTSSTLISRTQAVTISPDGTLVIASDAFGSTTSKYFTMSPGYDLSSLSSGTSFTWQGNSSHTTDTRFSSNGALLYGWTGTYIYNYTTGSTAAFSAADVGKKVVGNSGSAIITSTAGAYKSVTAFADTSAISSWQLFGAEGKSDGTGISLTEFAEPHTNVATPTHLNTLTWNSSYAKGRAIKISPDGTNFYAINYSSTASAQTVHRFSLSTPFDISTATFAETKDSVGQIVDALWNSDGTKLFLLGNSALAGIPSFVASTPYSLSNMTAGGNAGSLGNDQGGNTVLGGMCFNNDKTKLYISNRETNRIYEYDLNGSAGEIDGGLTFVGSVVTGVTAPMSIEMQSDGTKVWYTTLSDTTPRHHSMTLTTPFQISTAGSSTSYTFPSPVSTGTITRIFCFNAEQTKMYVSNTSTTENVFEFSIGNFVHPYSQYFPALTNSSTGQINSSSWQDINSMTADETKNDGDIFYAVSTDNRTSWGVAKGSEGVRKIAKNNSGTWQYNNSNDATYNFQLPSSALAFATGTSSSYSSKTTLNSSLSLYYATMIPVNGVSGKGLVVGDNDAGEMLYYTLATPYDLSSTLTAVDISSINWNPAGSNNWYGFCFNPDGTKIFTITRHNSNYQMEIRQFNLSTAYDLSTASLHSDYWGSGNGFPNFHSFDIAGVSDDKIYFCRTANYNYLHSKNLTASGDIDTSHTTLTQEANLPNDTISRVRISSDGKRIFAHDNGTTNHYLYTLTTAWDFTSLDGSATITNTTIDSVTNATSYINYDEEGKYIVGMMSSTDEIFLSPSSTSTVGNGFDHETWVNAASNNEHATLQQALSAQASNRMNKAQLDAVADDYHFSQDSADTLDLMIAPYAASGTSPISDGVTINYNAEALVKQAINGTDYEAYFPSSNSVSITSLAAQNLKIRII